MLTKICVTCLTVHDASFHNKDRSREDGLDPRCKNCTRAACKRTYVKHREKHLGLKQQWKDDNRERHRQLNRDWRLDNQDKCRATTARYRARLARATPAWVRQEDLMLVRSMCPPGWHVDHIHPLAGENVCGLNVPWNLQFLPPEVHWKKGNRLPKEEEHPANL